MIAKEIFRAYDIRGVVDLTLTEDAVFAIGRAIGTKVIALNGDSIVIGRDGRLSGPILSESLRKGILATGCNVVDIGVVPTPVLYFASHFLKIKSAVMLTGSHNPANYNGLKIIINDIAIYNESIQELYQIICTKKFAEGSGQYKTIDVAPAYIAAISNSVKQHKKLKIVIDCGNGAAGIIAKDLFNKLGCEVISLYCDIDGNFPNHHPDPSDPNNLTVLRETVIAQKADIGFAFDGDGDRVGIIDDKGKIIWPDRALMLIAQSVLADNPGATIIYDVKCSRDLATIINDAGGRALMWNTGHSLIKAKMRETNALLAAEMSGHVFFKDRWYGFDDALYTAARLIELLSSSTLKTSAQFAKFPEAYSTPELNIDVTEANKFSLMQELIKQAKEIVNCNIITVDGMRLEFSKGWGLIRPSNTTPRLVLRFEASTEEVLTEIKNIFRQMFAAIAPELELPF